MHKNNENVMQLEFDFNPTPKICDDVVQHATKVTADITFIDDYIEYWVNKGWVPYGIKGGGFGKGLALLRARSESAK